MMWYRRIYETVGIRYDDIAAMERIVDDVCTMLGARDEIDPRAPLIVDFNRLGPARPRASASSMR